jgi:hypothetical protein
VFSLAGSRALGFGGKSSAGVTGVAMAFTHLRNRSVETLVDVRATGGTSLGEM